ncbi:hypothetical protein T02_9408, partial [Trichinella nativa]
LPPCAPQRWAGGTPPATWRSSRTPPGCSDYHSVSPPKIHSHSLERFTNRLQLYKSLQFPS